MASPIRIPVIKLYSHLIVPIQGLLGDGVMEELSEQVSKRIVTDGVTGLIIDVSAVDVMDSYVTRVVRDLALTARLMGVDTVVSGMQANVAITIIEMGLEIPGVATTLNLERALEHLDQLHDDRDRERNSSEASHGEP
jgi:rsbT antagonist protein RsbS